MSINKQKYFQVTIEKLIKANNQTDAIVIAEGNKSISGEQLQQETFVERVYARDLYQELV